MNPQEIFMNPQEILFSPQNYPVDLGMLLSEFPQDTRIHKEIIDS